jgi:hypothetical protein
MPDSTEIFGLDLDVDKFVDGAKTAKDALLEVTDADNFSEMLGAMGEAAIALGVITVAATALKVAFDATLDTERIEKINTLFETLAKNVGLSATALREDLTKAAGGFATEVEVLNAANQAMINMNGNTARIPELMSLAQKMAIQFGGDMIEKFNGLAFAVETGNLRMLKHNGIIIDANKVLKEFAAEHGAVASELTVEGRQAAILDAVLEQGNQKYKDGAVNTDTLTAAWKRFKVEISEIGELFERAVSKIVGPTLKNFMQDLAAAAHNVKLALVSSLGDGAAQASAKLEILKRELKENQAAMDDLSARKKSGFTGFASPAEVDKDLAYLKTKQTQLLAESEAMKKKLAEASNTEGGSSKSDDEKELINEEAKAARIEKINEGLRDDIIKTKEDINKEDIKLADNQRDLEQAQYDRRVLEEAKINKDIQKAKSDAASGDVRAQEIANNEILLLEAQKSQKIISLAQQEAKERQDLADRSKKDADTFAEGWKQAAQKAEKASKDFATVGTTTFNAVTSNASKAFQMLGQGIADGSASASDIMKMFFIGAIADIAQAYGQTLLAAGIGSGNPVAIAEGGALISLSAILRAVAGGAGSSLGGSGGGGGGAGAPDSGYGAAGYLANNNSAPVANAQKSVTIQIQGNYFDTAESAQRLMQIVRQSADATDFKYLLIGGQ